MHLLEAAKAARSNEITDWEEHPERHDEVTTMLYLIATYLGSEWRDKTTIHAVHPWMMGEIDGVRFINDSGTLLLIRQCAACSEWMVSDPITSLACVGRNLESDEWWSDCNCPHAEPLYHHVLKQTRRDFDEGGLACAIRMVLNDLVEWQQAHPTAQIEHESSAVAESYRSDDLRYSTYALTIAYREVQA